MIPLSVTPSSPPPVATGTLDEHKKARPEHQGGGPQEGDQAHIGPPDDDSPAHRLAAEFLSQMQSIQPGSNTPRPGASCRLGAADKTETQTPKQIAQGFLQTVQQARRSGDSQDSVVRQAGKAAQLMALNGPDKLGTISMPF